MAFRIFHDNQLFDLSSLTPSSESQDLPATNVQLEPRTRVWRTGTSVDAESLVVDFGSAQVMKAFIAFYTTVSPSDSLIKIQGNASNSWGSPSFEQDLTANRTPYPTSTLFRNIYATTFSENFRYFRYIFTKASVGVTRDTGRIFLGTYYDMVRSPKKDGIDIQWMDGSNKFKGVGLNTFVEQKDKYRMINLSFPPVPQADIDALDAIYSRIGEGVNLFIQIDQTSPYDEILYVKFNGMYEKQLASPSSNPKVWSLNLSFEEQL